MRRSPLLPSRQSWLNAHIGQARLEGYQSVWSVRDTSRSGIEYRIRTVTARAVLARRPRDEWGRMGEKGGIDMLTCEKTGRGGGFYVCTAGAIFTWAGEQRHGAVSGR